MRMILVKPLNYCAHYKKIIVWIVISDEEAEFEIGDEDENEDDGDEEDDDEVDFENIIDDNDDDDDDDDDDDYNDDDDLDDDILFELIWYCSITVVSLSDTAGWQQFLYRQQDFYPMCIMNSQSCVCTSLTSIEYFYWRMFQSSYVYLTCVNRMFLFMDVKYSDSYAHKSNDLGMLFLSCLFVCRSVCCQL